jgi:ribosomal protein S18 acetylase RimI-like enzyme
MTNAIDASTVVAHDDRATATATLLAAFTADPLLRWMFPDAAQYQRWFPELVRHFAGGAFEHGSAHRTGDGSGVALWLPPGAGPDEEALGAMMQEAIGADRIADVFDVLEQVGSYHPDAPHWYLPAIGVDPPAQGRGFGSALLAHAVAIIDEQHVAAFLESSNPRNVPLYQRFGFEVVREVQSGSSPTVFPMCRSAR